MSQKTKPPAMSDFTSDCAPRDLVSTGSPIINFPSRTTDDVSDCLSSEQMVAETPPVKATDCADLTATCPLYPEATLKVSLIHVLANIEPQPLQTPPAPAPVVGARLTDLEVRRPGLDLMKRKSLESMLHVTFSVAEGNASPARCVFAASDLDTQGLHHCDLRAIFALGYMPAKRDILIRFRTSKRYGNRSECIFGPDTRPKQHEYLLYQVHLPLSPWLNEPGEGNEELSFRSFSVTSAAEACRVDPPEASELKGYRLTDLMALTWYSNKAWANDQLTPYSDPALFNLRWRRESEYARRCVRCLVAMLTDGGWIRLLLPLDTLTKAELDYLTDCSERYNLPMPGRSPWEQSEVSLCSAPTDKPAEDDV